MSVSRWLIQAPQGHMGEFRGQFRDNTLSLNPLLAPAGRGSSDAPPVRDDAPAHLGSASPGELSADRGLKAGQGEERRKPRTSVREASRKSQGRPPVRG